MIHSWMVLVWRRFNKSRANTLINIFGLTLGILVFLVILIYVQHEFSYDKFHKDRERIYRLIKSDGSASQAVMPATLEAVLKTEITGVESVARVTKRRTLAVEADNKTYYEDEYFGGDHDIFEILSFDVLTGNSGTALTTPMTVALSETTALKFFGTSDVVGRSLELTSQQNLGTYVVDAVFRDFPTNSSFNFNIIIRFEDFVKATQPYDLKNWNNWNYNYFLKTSKEASVNAIQESILNYLKINQPEQYRPEQRYYLERIVDMYLNPKVNFSLISQADPNRLYLLSAIAVLVLSIAVINHINLTVAKSLLRAKEVGIRKVTGALRADLIIQFLGDAWILSLISMFLALGILKLVWPLLTENFGKNIPLGILTDGVWLIGILVSPFVLGLAAGLYPAIYLSSFDPIRVLKGSFSRSKEGTFSRDVLITFQFMISAGLVISVLIINSQLKFIETADPGFLRERIITIPLFDEGVRNKKEVFLSELQKNPAIILASVSSSLPHSVGTIQSRIWKTHNQKTEVSFYTILADHNFLSLYGIRLMDGRNFLPGNKMDRSACLINETAAQLYGWDHPVGMEFTEESGDTTRIIGLIKDLHFLSYRDPIKPLRIGLSTDFTYVASVRVTGEKLPETLAYMESCYKKLATSKVPYKYNFFDDQYDRVYKNDYMLGRLIVVFSAIALMIAVLGLYSISIHVVNLRLREIGIRKVLGAPTYQIMITLSEKFIMLVFIGFLLAIPVTFYIMSEWLGLFAYHVSIGSSPFFIALLLVLVIAILTISLNVFNAAESNPVDVLKSE